MPSISGDGDGFSGRKGCYHHVNAEALDVFLHGGILEAASNQTLDIKEGPGAPKRDAWGHMGPKELLGFLDNSTGLNGLNKLSKYIESLSIKYQAC